MPVSYIDRALDATISSGGTDLKFINNRDYPVYLIFSVDESNGTKEGAKKKLTVEIYGQPLPDGQTIKVVSISKEYIPFDPLDVVYTLDPKLVRDGHNYYVDEAWQYYYDKDGNEIVSMRKRANKSVYSGNKPWMLDPMTPTPDPFTTPGTTPTPSVTPTP